MTVKGIQLRVDQQHTSEYIKLIVKIFYYEMITLMRSRTKIINAVVYYTLIISLFPLAMGPAPELLQRLAPGILSVAVLFANVLTLESLFKDDYMNGSIERILLSPQPISLIILTKVLVHSLLLTAALLIVSPVLALVLYLPTSTFIVLWAIIALATPSLCLLGAISCALTLNLQNRGLLLALMNLPLFIPTLIFSSSALTQASIGHSASGQLCILAALLILIFCFAPLAIVAALKIGTT